MGYIVINPITGHRLNWWDWKQWKARQNTFDNAFWETYRNEHKGTCDEVAQMVKKHFQAVGKYGRLARNVVTQGTGAIILKDAVSDLFTWIVRSGNFGKVKICALVHDEANCEYPEDLKEFPDILKKVMENSASKYCKSLPIPAVPEISDHWVH
jgi:DNA polymerase I-like protein with 3'-5' exonuclease and polymerase domains